MADRRVVPQQFAAKFDLRKGHRHPSDGLSVLIPFRGGERNDSLLIGLKYILTQNMDPIEIVIVEEDKKSTLDLGAFKDKPNIKHIFLESSAPFNKSRAMNCGVAHCKYECISMNDVDMLLEKTMLWNIYSILQKVNVCFSILEIYYLTDTPHTTPFYHNGQPWSSRANFHCHGGNVSFRKSAYIEIGGMNEMFVGHGSEDTEFFRRANKLTSVSDKRFAFCCHMPHPIADCQAEIDRNRKILDSLEKSDLVVLGKALKQNYLKNWGAIDPATSPYLVK